VRVFPQSSVAVHVRTYTAGQVPVGPLSTNVNDTSASQASVAVGVAKLGARERLSSVPARRDTGDWVSNTVSSGAGQVLPRASVAARCG
jgi:hypothetical protein